MNPKRTDRAQWREVDGRVIIIEPDRGNVHELNPVASFLWRQSDGTHAISALREKVIASFEVDPEIATRDVAEFFRDLEKGGLIEWRTTSV